MRLKPLVFLAIAVGFWFAGHSLELRGDIAPRLSDGTSPEAAKYHILALVMIIGALGCFIYAGVSLFRRR